MDMTDEEILEEWDNTKICEELIKAINEIKEKYIISEQEKKEIFEELKTMWGKEDYD